MDHTDSSARLCAAAQAEPRDTRQDTGAGAGALCVFPPDGPRSSAADIDLDVMVCYRARHEDRERWHRAARAVGKTFGAWARAVLSAEAARIEAATTGADVPRQM